MIHSLNSIRVLAEFWVVHMHLKGGTHPAYGMFVRDLMSFFFVLSGFVLSYSNRHKDFSSSDAKKEFWWKRFSKTYPIYLVIWIWDLIGALVTVCYTCCPIHLLCHLSQLLMMNPWIGCQLFLLVGPSWYIAVLSWFWLIFPYLHPQIIFWFKNHTWLKIAWVNLLATICIIGFNDYGYLTFSMLPALRVWEFIIGCAAATTINNRVHWVWPLIVTVFLVLYYVLSYYIFTHQTEQCYTDSEMGCTLWGKQELARDADPCIPRLSGQYMNKFAILWAILIQWIAASEHLNIEKRYTACLENSHLLKTLSKFSLHLYLSHSAWAAIFRAISGGLKFYHPWSMDILMIATYLSSYCLHRFIQPKLDWCTEWMYRWKQRATCQGISTDSPMSTMSVHT
jgi:peptidoglycan/LPS O-acetylase OafA/YrhL